MFDSKYHEWNQKRIKGIIDFYGYKFFYMKKCIGLSSGYAEIEGAIYRLGADITCVEARPEHIKVILKKFPGIKTLQADLDRDWPFKGRPVDLILSLGSLCHLSNYQEQIRRMCASTTHLILETTVCDSDDENKCITMGENKGVYDFSINGVSTRPSTAAIERMLAQCGMNYKRVDSARFNAHPYVYDWAPQNKEECDFNKRRIWFCVKSNSPVQFAPQTAPTPNVVSFNQPAYLQQGHSSRTVSNTATIHIPTPLHANYSGGYSADIDQIRSSSRRFSLLKPATWISPQTFDINGTILATTVSSSLWFKKISPFFPQLKAQHKSLSLLDFPRSNQVPDLIMCDLDNLQPANRLWIDEWSNRTLTDQDINALRQSNTIITPSLLNAQEILSKLPYAQIIRCAKPWGSLNVSLQEGSYYLYMEKSAQQTQLLLRNWDSQFGKLIVVGSSYKLPMFAQFISDSEEYNIIISLIGGALGVIDLTINNYCLSGLQNLVKSLGIPLITNNTAIEIDRKTILLPELNTQEIGKAISNINGKKEYNFNKDYNSTIMVSGLKKMLGQSC
jgi:hypothetical protein